MYGKIFLIYVNLFRGCLGCIGCGVVWEVIFEKEINFLVEFC